ncbi:MAG: thiamine phosphate synthase [Lachnospiraceae bacterium]|nr:thiamine phosphate synthase [Lachnospiraceae bacterium]
MRCDSSTMKLYAVTDRSWLGGRTLYELVEEALLGGVTCVQLREKNLPEEAFLAEAISICRLCRKYGVPFIINDNLEIAQKCGADGVHVGQDDMCPDEVRRRAGDKMIIGVTAHTVAEAVEAQKRGADYLGAGAVFQTGTKSNTVALSYETLQAICASVQIPVVAIGGIAKSNLMALAGSGVSGVAVVSAIFAAEDVRTASAELLELSGKMTGQMPV